LWVEQYTTTISRSFDNSLLQNWHSEISRGRVDKYFLTAFFALSILTCWRELMSFPKQKPYTLEVFQEGREIIDQHERDKKSSRDNTPRQDKQFERTNQTKHKPSRVITSIKKSKKRYSAQKTRHNHLNYTKQQPKTAWQVRGGRHGKSTTNHYNKDRNHVRKRRKLHKFMRTNSSNQEHTQGADPGCRYRRKDKLRNEYRYDGTDAKSKERRAYRTDRQVAGDIAARQACLQTLSVIARHESNKEKLRLEPEDPMWAYARSKQADFSTHTQETRR